MSDPRPIGLFDSGVGGLTVLREVRARLPRESTLYLGDNARAPYGSRPNDEVVMLSGECLDWLLGQDIHFVTTSAGDPTKYTAQLKEAGLLPQLLQREHLNDEEYTALATAYFQQQIPCPFLEDESCSIHAERPHTQASSP